MDKPQLAKKPRLFYGYWIVIASFGCVAITSGCGFYAFSLFVKSLQTDLGWSRSGIMVALSIYFLVGGLASPYVGHLIDRYGVRKVIAIGALVTGLGFLMLSQMKELWHFYTGYSIIGSGIAATGTLPATTVVSNWFKKRRGTAIGLMSTGVGGGGFILSPIIGSYLIPSFGWRIAYLVLAALNWAVILPLAFLVIRTKPQDVGLYPDGAQATEVETQAKTPSSTEGASLKMVLSGAIFWLMAISFLASSFSNVGVVQNQVPYLEDIGFQVSLAAGALGGVGLGSLFGKFGFGWLCDRIAAEYAYCLGLLLQIAGIATLMLVKPSSSAVIIWLYAITIGLGVGSWLPTMSMLSSSNFGLSAYGAIFGMISFAQSIGSAAGPLLAGYIYDQSGSYHWAFIIFLTLYLVSGSTILAMHQRKSSYLFQESRKDDKRGI